MVKPCRRITTAVLVCSLLCCMPNAVVAQQRKAPPTADLLDQLHQLKNVACVLYVAAHPDDENTRLLAWLARGQHVRTVYLSLTRGDGGQNILGAEQAAGLGLIRTNELLQARTLDGAEQLFTRAVDFGFSKSAEETFVHWDRIRLIADVVRAIRYVRPDVVICRFPKDSMAGHGQHSASAIIAEQAFDYCHGTLVLPQRDMQRLDSLLAVPVKGSSEPWKPTSLLFNAFRFGNRSTISDSMFKVTVGQYDPLFGMGYGELAGISRSLHRSQGAGTPSTPGVADEYFATLRGKPLSTSLFDGVQTTWERIGMPQVDHLLMPIITAFSVEHPERSLNQLFALRRILATAPPQVDSFWLAQKRAALDKAILGCMGLAADVTVPVQTVLAGQTVAAHVRLVQRSGMAVQVTTITSSQDSFPIHKSCDHDVLLTDTLQVTIPIATPVSNPYWLNSAPQGALYTLASDSLLQWPTSQPTMPLSVTIVRGYDTLTFSVPLSSKRLDPLHGDVIEGLRVLPRASVEPLSTIVFAGGDSTKLPVRVHAYDSLRTVKVQAQQGNRVVGSVTIAAMSGMSDTVIHIPIRTSHTSPISVVCKAGSFQTADRLHEIRYEHLSALQYQQPARVYCSGQSIPCKARTVGYIVGAGDATADALRALGVTVVELDDSHLLDAKELAAYDAIVVGVRAVNVHKTMKVIMPSLLAYVQNGGTLVMQYNTTQDMSTKQLGPWSFTLSRNRVTEELAPVTMLAPNHVLFTKPNVIGHKDFDGWVQERGLYFPSGIDAHYETLLSMADTGEPQQTGSLLYARYGKGHYVYCALSLFRQLPAGVLGGYKLLANMVSLSR